jgi:hypothetical protein
VLLKRPIDARYRKSLHFTPEFYPEIFDESRLTPEFALSIVKLFKAIESERKAPNVEVLSRYPFIPLASHFLLLVMAQQIGGGERVSVDNIESLMIALKQKSFPALYHTALQILSDCVRGHVTTPGQSTDAMAMTHLFRSEAFAQEVIAASDENAKANPHMI